MTAPGAEDGRTVVVNGVATHYHDVGSGPVLLLIHGSGPGVSAWANWRGVLPDLARHFRVVAPDILGFGRSQPPGPVHYDPSTWMAHLLGFLDALELDRFSVVGNSFGGSLALRLALARPAAVARLGLMGSVGVDAQITPGLRQVWGFTPSLPNMRQLLDLFAYDGSRITDDLAELRLAAATQPGVQESYAAMFPEPRQAALDALNVPDEAITTIRQPTLIIHGRDDQVIPLSNSLRLLHLIPQSQLHVFGQCGHWVQIEEQHAFVAMVTQFMVAAASRPA